MNLNLVKVNVIVLILVIESHGGLIDGVYGRIKNTTDGLKQDVANVWTYSKGLVGRDETAANEQKEEERGLIGGMFHSAHEKIHSLHEQLWVVEDIPNDSGLLWNMYNRMKQRLAKAKHFILGDANGNKPIEDNTALLSEESKVIKDAMEKLFYADGTRKVDENTFNEAIRNLKRKLNEMRNQPASTTTTPVHHGEGLIDVRLADVSKDFEDNAANAAGVDNDIYDKVNDNMNAVNDKTREVIYSIPDKVNRNVNNGIEAMKNGMKKVNNGAVALKDNAADTAAKEEDLLNSYNKLNQKASDMGDAVKKSADDMTRLAYS